MTDFKQKFRTGAYIEPTEITLGVWIIRWLSVYKENQVSTKTYADYVTQVMNHVIPAIGDIPLKNLTPDVIQEFFNSKMKGGRADGKEGGLSSRRTRMLHQLINGCLKRAVVNKMILSNPSETSELPAVKYKQMEVYSKEEVTKYLNAVKDDRLFPAFLVELTTGLRSGELLAVRWPNLDLGKGAIRIVETVARVKAIDAKKSKLEFSDPKTEASIREIPLIPPVVQALKRHKSRQAEEPLFWGQAYNKENLVFPTNLGTPLEPQNFYRKHCSIIRKAGLKHIRVHDLRHTFATLLLEEGENPEVLRDFLGHTKTSTTLDLYCHSTKKGKEKALPRIASLIDAVSIN
jgi:integrase